MCSRGNRTGRLCRFEELFGEDLVIWLDDFCAAAGGAGCWLGGTRVGGVSSLHLGLGWGGGVP